MGLAGLLGGGRVWDPGVPASLTCRYPTPETRYTVKMAAFAQQRGAGLRRVAAEIACRLLFGCFRASCSARITKPEPRVPHPTATPEPAEKRTETARRQRGDSAGAARTGKFAKFRRQSAPNRPNVNFTNLRQQPSRRQRELKGSPPPQFDPAGHVSDGAGACRAPLWLISVVFR